MTLLTEVVGQDTGVHFLRRVAEGKYTSPLLLVGDEGVGRRFAVTQLAKEVYCTREREQGCTCLACTQVNQDMHVDLISITAPDDKEIGVEQIRQVTENSDAYPSTAPLKFIVVDGADRMTTAAANAFLKTLEEPSTSVRFFLLAEDATKVLPTIRSRCGLVHFKHLPDSFILSTLQRFESDSTKALVLSRMAEGSAGRALRYWGSGQLGLRDRIVALLTTALSRDLPAVLSQVSSIDKDLPLGIRVMDQILHDLLMVHHDPSRVIHLDVAERLKKMRGQAPDQVWGKLSTGLKVVQERRRYGKIDLSFHIQTLFADTFFGK